MPLVQLGVRVDDLRVPQQPVAEVVYDGGDGEDAAKTFIKSRLGHDFVLPQATARLSRGPFRGPNLAGSDLATTLALSPFHPGVGSLDFRVFEPCWLALGSVGVC